MDHDYSMHNLNAIRNLRAAQNEDVIANSIDQMLLHLKNLLKKYLTIKKIYKELQETQTEMDQQTVNSKIALINDQTKNLPLSFNKNIPPDKRMTNLFFMRILKEISYYDKIVPNFIEIISKIQETYNEQVRQNKFSILALYLVCEKRFIQQIKMSSLKVLHILDQKKMKFIVEKIHLQQSYFDKTSNSFKQTNDPLEPCSYQRVTISDFNKDIIAAILDIFVQKKTEQNDIVGSIHEAIQKRSCSIMADEYKDIVTPIYQDIYSPLDLAGIDLVSWFIPTLRPDDNIELIYRKVAPRNKKSKKQIKQFLTGFEHYLQRKREHLKRKMRHSILYPKHDLRLQRIQPLQQQQHQKKKQQETQQRSLKAIDFLKPIREMNKQRSIKLFRQYNNSESLQNSNSVSTTISHFRPNNLAPIIQRSRTQGALQIRLKSKLSSQLGSKQKRQKQNDSDNSTKLLKKQKKSKEKKFEIKNIKIVQKRGKSLKTASKGQLPSKKLRL